MHNTKDCVHKTLCESMHIIIACVQYLLFCVDYQKILRKRLKRLCHDGSLRKKEKEMEYFFKCIFT